MGSPLGPFLTGIIMVELDNSIVPKLNSHLRFWKRYVDDTLTIIKEGSINHVFQQLNLFHPNIQFTFERELVEEFPFLTSSLYGKGVALKQQFTEKVQALRTNKSTNKKHRHLTQLVLICIEHMETRNFEKLSLLSVQYLLYRISFEE